MRYVIQVNHITPEGHYTGTDYWVADNEREMEAMLAAAEGSYAGVTCIGPVTKPDSWWQSRIQGAS